MATVVTAKGKNRNHYGKKFSKKHKSAMLEFTKSVWLQDATTSLRNLLKDPEVAKEFLLFLKSEYGESQLEFFLEAERLATLPMAQRLDAAKIVYSKFLKAGGQGIGEQDRTEATQQIWDYVNSASDEDYVDGTTALKKIAEEAEVALRMMAFDAFPRFLKSSHMVKVMARLQKSGMGNQAQSLMETSRKNLPKDADDWINMFITAAETFPACIVISDMTISGAPMIYINPEFTRVTGYSSEEATGRNCRFLQGPETEPESIRVIRNTLSKGQDCHVKLTNYRKNGEKFQNLLSMKPVFDADGIYRYVIGVQFEVVPDSNLKSRLVQLDKLLRLLPKKLPGLRSKASARAKGNLAAKVTGEANTLIDKKDDIAAYEKENSASEKTSTRPRQKEAVEDDVAPTVKLNYDNSIFFFTRFIWLQQPMAAMRGILRDGYASKCAMEFLSNYSDLLKDHAKFCIDVFEIAAADARSKRRLMFEMHRRMWKNPLFYCARTEIVIGELPQTDFRPIEQELMSRLDKSLEFLSREFLPRFMNSKFAVLVIKAVQKREQSGASCPLATAAAGLDRDSPSFWLDMFKVTSETLSIGAVISDMTIPGIPLNYINDGFKTVTGYGKEKIGTSCRFLQGPETEVYLDEEIIESLRNCDPLCIKLHNYKADGDKFQCLFCLHPVFGPNQLYKYQVGVQLDFRESSTIKDELAEMDRFLRCLPHSLDGKSPEDLKRLPSTFTGEDAIPVWITDVAALSVKEGPVKAPAAAAGDKTLAVTKPAEVVTNKGKATDHYGRKFSKRQNAAMLQFTKTMWMQDAETTLRGLINEPAALKAFSKFLEAEYADSQLAFVVKAAGIEKMGEKKKADAAVKLYSEYLAAGGSGIGEQDRTKATQELWDAANQDPSDVPAEQAVAKVQEEADQIIRMLSFDAFPRFMKSKSGNAMIEAVKKAKKGFMGFGGKSGEKSALESMLENAGSQLPQDADEWLNMFISIAETYPACIVISDMTIPGAPMVYVNPEFCRVTLYSREEATGRNCRFLQGPLTEPESIRVIRNTLSKGQDCHVKLTNYRKNGELFQNLLSMRPVFDTDGIYRYVIGVQFEIVEGEDLKTRLVKLDKLLKMLPRKLPMKSRAAARAKGQLAAKVSGEANDMVKDKEAVIKSSRKAEMEEASAAGKQPKALVDQGNQEYSNLNYDMAIVGFTKIIWKRTSKQTMAAICSDPNGLSHLKEFIKTRGSILARFHVDFLDQVLQINDSGGSERLALKLHRKMEYNPLFYCTTNEIVVGTMNQIEWSPVLDTMNRWKETSIEFLHDEFFDQFLDSRHASDLILEISGPGESADAPLRSAAAGIKRPNPNFWLEMYKVMTEHLTIGAVVSDMTIPGIPLNYINEGFQRVTGFGKEKIGTSCRFLQGPGTEGYLDEEIIESLRNFQQLHVKLHNYKASGEKFQCLFSMKPVFGPKNEYKYQCGLQLEFDGEDLYRELEEMSVVLHFLPQAVDGTELQGYGDRVAAVEKAFRELAGDRPEKYKSKAQSSKSEFQTKPVSRPARTDPSINPYTGRPKSMDKPKEPEPDPFAGFSAGVGMSDGKGSMGGLGSSILEDTNPLFKEDPVPEPQPAPTPTPTMPTSPKQNLYGGNPGSPYSMQAAQAPMGGGLTPAPPQSLKSSMPSPRTNMAMQQPMAMVPQMPTGGFASEDMALYSDTMHRLMRPIAWVVLPGGIRCPVVADDANMSALATVANQETHQNQ